MPTSSGELLLPWCMQHLAVCDGSGICCMSGLIEMCQSTCGSVGPLTH